MHPNYLSYEHLWIVSRDEFLSHFCETPFIWGCKLNIPCSSFANYPRFLNMVMTFTLTPLSHYNSITKPRAHFLLSLMEDLFIDFPSHFITSILDVYQPLIISSSFLWLSCGSFNTLTFPFFPLLSSPPWVPSMLVLFNGARSSFNRSGHKWRWQILQLLLFYLLLRLLPPLLLLP